MRTDDVYVHDFIKYDLKYFFLIGILFRFIRPLAVTECMDHMFLQVFLILL
jgi:hypothetical protein